MFGLMKKQVKALSLSRYGNRPFKCSESGIPKIRLSRILIVLILLTSTLNIIVLASISEDKEKQKKMDEEWEKRRQEEKKKECTFPYCRKLITLKYPNDEKDLPAFCDQAMGILKNTNEKTGINYHNIEYEYKLVNTTLTYKEIFFNCYVARAKKYANENSHIVAARNYQEAFLMFMDYKRTYSIYEAIKAKSEELYLSGDAANSVLYCSVFYINSYMNHYSSHPEILNDIINSLGKSYFFLGQYNKAIKHFNWIISESPNNAVFYDNRGKALAFQGDYSSAVKDYLDGLRIDSSYINLYIDLSNTYIAMHDNVNAELYLNKLFGVFAGVIDLNSLDINALKIISDSINNAGVFPNEEDLSNTAADAYDAGDFKKAAVYYLAAQKILPDDPDFVFSLASSYKGLKMYFDAIYWYNRYLYLVPNAEDKADVENTIKTLINANHKINAK